MTTANSSFQSLLELAEGLGCVGIEARNDLGGELFDGCEPLAAKHARAHHGIRILALAEVRAFNDMSNRVLQDATRLAELAEKSGAEAIVLIPRNDGQETDQKTRLGNLRASLEKLAPILEQHNMLGLVEPLGFTQCSIRSKTEVVQLIEELGVAKLYKLVHDTFHHYLAEEKEIYPEHTGIVHISGVVNPSVVIETMRDEHRVLVDTEDRLGNLEQISQLIKGGYKGPVSVEAFSPLIHELENPKEALMESFRYIESEMSNLTSNSIR